MLLLRLCQSDGPLEVVRQAVATVCGMMPVGLSRWRKTGAAGALARAILQWAGTNLILCALLRCRKITLEIHRLPKCRREFGLYSQGSFRMAATRNTVRIAS
jgi:hypothetical protein